MDRPLTLFDALAIYTVHQILNGQIVSAYISGLLGL